MRMDILAEVERLRAEGAPFALATVVATRPPTSGVPGARAIVLPDATLHGWVGGACVQPTVVRQGLAALADAQSRLVVISPDAPADLPPREGIVPVAMTCAGQGELQIFVEPFLPRAEVVVVGSSPVARAIARLASVLDFAVVACD